MTRSPSPTTAAQGRRLNGLVLVLVEAVVRELVERGETITLDPRLLERVRRWFADEVVGETQRREIIGEIGSDASAGLDFPLIAQFAARVRGTLRSSNDYRKEIRQRAARDPEELLNGANALLQGVHDALAERKQQICVVFDNLEKLHDRKQIDAAILSRADDLRRLRCHVVYFFSPADQYAPVTIQANQLFKIIEVPVIPVRLDRAEPADHVCDEALQAITRLLEYRLVIDALFAQPEACIRSISVWSGGRLRDIIELARQACEFADFDPRANKVDTSHIERAARKLAGLRSTVMTPACWTRAVEIHESKAISNRDEDGLMLRNSLVLAYDGEPWWDVHPFILHDPRFAAATTGVVGNA